MVKRVVPLNVDVDECMKHAAWQLGLSQQFGVMNSLFACSSTYIDQCMYDICMVTRVVPLNYMLQAYNAGPLLWDESSSLLLSSINNRQQQWSNIIPHSGSL